MAPDSVPDSAPDSAGSADLDSPELLRRAERFVTREARLLDDWRLDEWLALFHPAGRYWVPMAWGQTDPVNHISLYWEDVPLLKMRIERLQHEQTASQLPRSRTCHQMTNVTLEPPGTEGADLRAVAAFTMAEYRRDEMRWFAGFTRYDLVDEGDDFRIRLKRVDLLNCDSDAGHLRFSVPF